MEFNGAVDRGPRAVAAFDEIPVTHEGVAPIGGAFVVGRQGDVNVGSHD